jgi:hypothetical protein
MDRYRAYRLQRRVQGVSCQPRPDQMAGADRSRLQIQCTCHMKHAV